MIGDAGDKSRQSRDEAIETLWHAHRRRLVRLAVGLTGDSGAGEEIVQDAFAGLVRRWWQLRDPEAAAAYLQRAVVNAARKGWKRRQRTSEVVARFGEAERGVLAAEDVRADVLSALSRLPYGKRACLVLRYYEDLTEPQVAELLGISVGTVKSQCARGLRQLETVLGPEWEETR